MENKNDIFYGIGGQENLDADIDDVITGWYENLSKEEIAELTDDYELEIIKYEHYVIGEESKKYYLRITLNNIYEHLDESYGNPDDFEGTCASAEIQEKAKELIDMVCNSYSVWRCHPVETIKVKIFDYLF